MGRLSFIQYHGHSRVKVALEKKAKERSGRLMGYKLWGIKFDRRNVEKSGGPSRHAFPIETKVIINVIIEQVRSHSNTATSYAGKLFLSPIILVEST